MKNQTIESVECHKHLGVYYDRKMTFNRHSSEIIQNSYKKYNFLKNICKTINGKVFLKLYKTYVLPKIEYSNKCWVPTKSQAISIEKV